MLNTKTKLGIIHVGPEDRGTSWQRIQALRDLGHDVNQIYYSYLYENLFFSKKIYRSLRRRIGWPAEQCNENIKLLVAVKKHLPDIIFIEKGLTIWPSTLKRIKLISPQTVVINYSLDDMMNPNNQSIYYIKALPLFDVLFTTKKYNINELLTLGAKRVELTGNAYSPHVHRPISVSEKDRLKYGADVTFVGGYEKERAISLNYLAMNDISVRIWGNNWHRFKNPHPNLILEKRPAYAEDYGKVVCSSKILLGFLRKCNRDTITTRSIEIPAFKAFMLAERSIDHLSLFKEGIEAEYFGSNEELLEKIKFYLFNDNKRLSIAKSGFEKCINLGLSYNKMMEEIINICKKILSSKAS